MSPRLPLIAIEIIIIWHFSERDSEFTVDCNVDVNRKSASQTS